MTTDSAPLERLLSKWHVASRTAARALITAGRVRVAGAVCTDPRRWVDPALEPVALDDSPLAPARGELVHLALNKPRGVIATTHDPDGRRTVMDLVPRPVAPGLAPAGRLDRASAGLLLLTNDHALAAILLNPASHVTKVYRVKVRGHPTDASLARLCEESIVDDGIALGPMDVRVESCGPRSAWLEVALREGKNRQIRRRLADVGHTVEHLIRVEFGPIALGDLSPGAVRMLRADELASLRASAGHAGRR